jgi:hypothetical protein
MYSGERDLAFRASCKLAVTVLEDSCYGNVTGPKVVVLFREGPRFSGI